MQEVLSSALGIPLTEIGACNRTDKEEAVMAVGPKAYCVTSGRQYMEHVRHIVGSELLHLIPADIISIIVGNAHTDIEFYGACLEHPSMDTEALCFAREYASKFNGKCLASNEGNAFWPMMKILSQPNGSIDPHQDERLLASVGSYRVLIDLLQEQFDMEYMAQRLATIMLAASQQKALEAGLIFKTVKRSVDGGETVKTWYVLDLALCAYLLEEMKIPHTYPN